MPEVKSRSVKKSRRAKINGFPIASTRLQTHIEATRLSSAEFAKLAGVDAAVVEQVAEGKLPDKFTTLQMLWVLGLTWEEIFIE